MPSVKAVRYCIIDYYVGLLEVGLVAVGVRYPSMWVIMYDDIENYIRFYSQLIVNLVIAFCFSEYVEFFQGVHHMAFIGDVDGIHNVFHWVDGVPIFYKLLNKTRLIISVFKIPKSALGIGL